MTEAAAVPVVPAEKKFVREYQPKDEYGNAIGPPQKFEAETQKELIDLLAAAHENASVAVYKTKRDAKLGRLIEDADPEQPLPTFEERSLTADERVKITNALKDPAGMPDAIKTLLEAQFGAPPAKVREALMWIAVNDRANLASNNVFLFRQAHPDYVECEANREAMEVYLNKNKMGYTKKNLALAFEALKADGLVILRAAEVRPKEPVAPATPSEAVITPPVTAPTPISAEPVVQEGTSPSRFDARGSSSVSARGSSAPQVAVAPKAPGITIADVNRMTAAQYAEACKNPDFVKQVEALYKK